MIKEISHSELKERVSPIAVHATPLVRKFDVAGERARGSYGSNFKVHSEEGDDPEAKPFVHHANDEDNQPTRPLVVRPSVTRRFLPSRRAPSPLTVQLCSVMPFPLSLRPSLIRCNDATSAKPPMNVIHSIHRVLAFIVTGRLTLRHAPPHRALCDVDKPYTVAHICQLLALFLPMKQLQ